MTPTAPTCSQPSPFAAWSLPCLLHLLFGSHLDICSHAAPNTPDVTRGHQEHKICLVMLLPLWLSP